MKKVYVTNPFDARLSLPTLLKCVVLGLLDYLVDEMKDRLKTVRSYF